MIQFINEPTHFTENYRSCNHIRLLKHVSNVLGTLNIPYIGQWYRTFTLRNGWPTWIRSMTFGSVDEIKSIHELEFFVKWVGSLINWIILYFTNILDILLFWSFNWSSLKSPNTTIVFTHVSTDKSIECSIKSKV
jgi:hypothetical protein